MFACFCVHCTQIQHNMYFKSSRVVQLVTIFDPALLVPQHGSVGELGFTHVLLQRLLGV